LYGFRLFDQFDGMSVQSEQRSGSGAAESDSDGGVLNVSPHAQEGLDPDEPPPPPALDDPLDPPPTIDVEYLAAPGSMEVLHEHPPPPHSDQDPHPVPQISSASPPSRTLELGALSIHAPPPYATPVARRTDSESVTRPPPYIDE